VEQPERLSQEPARLEVAWAVDELLLLTAGEREATAAERETWAALLNHQILIRRRWCHLHLNRSASDPLMWCTIKLQKFRPLNALISAPVRSDRPGHHEGKKGEQHAEALKTWV
jgi:hypothetical protein